MVERRLELRTLGSLDPRSNQLSYTTDHAPDHIVRSRDLVRRPRSAKERDARAESLRNGKRPREDDEAEK